MKFRQVVLDHLPFDISGIVASGSGIRNIAGEIREEVFETAERTVSRMVARIHGHVIGGLPIDEPEVVEPASWFQHLRRSLGLSHRTRVLRPAVRHYARICPHIECEPGKHVTFLMGEDVLPREQVQ